ncbi:MAG: transcriptional repressor LexA [Anaerolineales bacterium]
MGQRPYKPKEERCNEILAYVSEYFDRHYMSPTYDEIMKGVGIKSKGHLAPLIDKLVEAGSLEQENGVARGLRLPGWTPPTNQIPVHLKGFIAASNENPVFVLDEFDADTTVEIPPSYIPKNTKPTDLYALTVQGNSMEDALIGDGDTVILKQGDLWNDGDTVAVWLKNEGAATLKELYRTKNHTVRLKPRSHKHQTRVENEEDIRVMGRVIAVLRKY